MRESGNDSLVQTVRVRMASIGKQYRDTGHKVFAIPYTQSLTQQLRAKMRVYFPFLLTVVFIVSGQLHIDTPLSMSLGENEAMYFVTYFLLLTLFLYLYFLTMLSDPGTVRHVDTSQDDMEKTHQRYCNTCYTWKAVRSRHCDRCHRCIVVFDHHCPFFDTCIGGLNRRYYWSFLLSSVALLSWTFSIALEGLLRVKQLDEHVSIFVYELICLVVLAAFILSSATLLALHTWLAVTNQTTRELVRRWNKNETVSSSASLRHNLAVFFLGRLKPEWLEYREESVIQMA